MRIYLKARATEELLKGVLNDVYAHFFLVFFVKTYVLDFHKNLADKSRR